MGRNENDLEVHKQFSNMLEEHSGERTSPPSQYLNELYKGDLIAEILDDQKLLDH